MTVSHYSPDNSYEQGEKEAGYTGTIRREWRHGKIGRIS
jgi:hypothetical protein